MHCSTGTFGGCAFFRFHCVQYLQSTGDISVAVVFADELSLLLPRRAARYAAGDAPSVAAFLTLVSLCLVGFAVAVDVCLGIIVETIEFAPIGAVATLGLS